MGLKIEECLSPHYNSRPIHGRIWMVVIHATAGGSLESTCSWFQNPQSKVSSHYTIGKDGRIMQHVKEYNRAWHAGESTWKGQSNCNDYSIGIELVNLNDGEDPYPAEQMASCCLLTAELVKIYGMNVDDVVAHYDISPTRKTDPKGFDMVGLHEQIEVINNSV